MSPARLWQRELNNSESRPTVPTPPKPASPIDLPRFVVEVFDGVVGDRPAADLSTMDTACDAVIEAVVAKVGRPLRDGERAKVYIEAGAEFNRRRQAAAGRTDASFSETVALLRDADRCPECGKTRAVINVASRGFRPERITTETHCTCPGGPAYAGIGSTLQERAS